MRLSDRETDRQTDGQTFLLTRLPSIQCSAVKTDELSPKIVIKIREINSVRNNRTAKKADRRFDDKLAACL